MTAQVTTADQLREAWMAFFEERGHTRHPSAPLIPENDPTLLFTGAGMNQFKAMFLGKGSLPFTRAATIQKCFRQGDLDNVGRTLRHLTYFEMMGHFSFGDYFKAEAIPWAWEMLTKVLGLPADRLRVSVYRDDDVALDTWLSVGVSRDAIGRFDAKENYWPADAPEKGPNGPCGPCTEIFFDYGKEAELGDGGSNGFDSGRYVEIWNSVFTQYERVGPNDLQPLPQRNIDCGAGLERVLAAMEREQSPFGTSLFRPLVSAVAELADTTYTFDPKGGQAPGEDARRIRRIAEHVRASCMLVADGVKPSNEGRGYVLRRVLRRAIRDGIQLGLTEPFLHELVTPVLGVLGVAHPSLREGEAVLQSTLKGEDERFRQTYRGGLRYLEDEIKRLSGKTLSGEAAFRLYDTYGFPLDLAELILEERGLAVDHAGFEQAMEAQRTRARAGSKLQGEIFAGGPLTELAAKKVPTTRFEGYGHPGIVGKGQVVGLIDAENQLVDRVPAGEEVTVILDATPFYAEAGGQVGDRGELRGDGVRASILDTQKREGYHLHRGRVEEGELRTGLELGAEVDSRARDATRRNHTATHLLHEALQRVLGDHIRQEGSLVDPERLRFDISHPKALSDEELAAIEAMVTGWIVANDEVATQVMDLEEAKASGATALFGEKYDSAVRVVGVSSGSRELCGGTHCLRTGDIGGFQITVETSIAAGVRRIEAVTGFGASAMAREEHRLVRDLAGRLKAKPDQVLERIEALQGELRNAKKQIEKAAREAGAASAQRLADDVPEIGGLKVKIASVPGVEAKALKGVWDILRKAGVDAALLVGEQGGKAPLLAAVSPRGVEAGLDARQLLKAAASKVKGGGGGKAPMAQGQGQDRSQIDAALDAVRAHVEAELASA